MLFWNSYFRKVLTSYHGNAILCIRRGGEDGDGDGGPTKNGRLKVRKELTKPTAADVGAFCYQWIATHKGYFSITSAADRKMEKEYGPDQTYPLYLDAAKRFRVSAEKARGAADNGHKRHSKAEALQAKIQEFCYDLYHVGQKSKPTTALIRWGVTEDQRKRLVKLKIATKRDGKRINGVYVA